MIKPPESLAKRIGIRFNDLGLLQRALTHRSADGRNNERLEFLGDSVLGYVIAERLYEMFPTADEGVLSRLRATLVNQSSLASIARSHELGDYLILGSGELKSGGFRRDSILSDALEAVMGAIVKDQGIDVCREWIQRVFEDAIGQLSLNDWKKDPKTCLQEIMQSRGADLPVYSLLATDGQAHAQQFRVDCRIALLSDVTEGEGTSRKRAEQQAAERMLARLSTELNIQS
ncbi:MAG: ribonuclease III [Methylococcaceae bacterium]|nr:ribonuclease III [Methylococcaceae bacterium]